jgi:hypothetical protein
MVKVVKLVKLKWVEYVILLGELGYVHALDKEIF